MVDNVVLLWRPQSGLSLPRFKERNDLQLVKHTPGVVNEALGVKVDSAIKVLPGSNVPIGPPQRGPQLKADNQELLDSSNNSTTVAQAVHVF